MRPLELQVGDHVQLRISPIEGVIRFGVRDKLNPGYIRSFQILEKVRDLAYCLSPQLSLTRVYDVFHVSYLKQAHDSVLPSLKLSHKAFHNNLIVEPICIFDSLFSGMGNMYFKF